ncbi:peptide deformylase [Streptosporangium sp. KLBMP 9127]|nr:peptide deformylase [Streptosporangium sp. KLBMP 9127]
MTPSRAPMTAPTAPAGTAREVLDAPHTLLTTMAAPVDPADPRVVEAAADLLATLRRADDRLGVSAPQIGLGWRLLAIDVSSHPRTRSCAGELVLVNPRLTQAARWETAREGCLSVPGLVGEVRRATRITVTGQRPGDGESLTFHTDAFEARCLQHQLDHLDGVLFLDRMPTARAVHRARHPQSPLRHHV